MLPVEYLVQSLKKHKLEGLNFLTFQCTGYNYRSWV